MKGQFFLVGALALILMFYIGISVYLSPFSAKPSLGEDIENLFSNIKNEYPRVLNFGLNDSLPVQTLVNFTNYAIDETEGRGSDFRALWLITQNISDDLNITVGNFLGYNTNVTLTISSENKQIQVDDGKTNSAIFTSAPSEFNLTLNFNTKEKNLLLEKYKTNLYLILEMIKGDEIISGETKA